MGLDHEECKGCYNHGNCFLRCYHPLEANKCLCMNCIVKVMRNRMCEALVEVYFRGLKESNNDRNST